MAHRLAQPHHIFALPDQDSHPFVDPAQHDQRQNILPHQESSAYVHSKDYQERLLELEKSVLERLKSEGRTVHFEHGVNIEKIEKIGGGYVFQANSATDSFHSDKVVVATGAAPSRSLPTEIVSPGNPDIDEKILTYNDILTESIAEKVRDKDVLIYGGGATSAWAMEVSEQIGKSSLWLAKSGFDQAESAGPRVEAIIEGTRASQAKGIIKSINLSDDLKSPNKLKVVIQNEKPDGSNELNTLYYDYVVNCIGQDSYEKGGLHEVLASNIKDELLPIFDKNQVSGRSDTVLGFGTGDGGLELIGAAAASYYDYERNLKPGRAVSEDLPRSARVPITIGGVVSSVSAFNNYMPLSQNPKTGEISVDSLNVNVMSKQQLAVYYSGKYQDAHASIINAAVDDLLKKRSKTEFGLPDEELSKFEASHFGQSKKAVDIASVDSRSKSADRSTERDRTTSRSL